ncbi:MAG: glycoside hydrolase family 57 [Chitinispirillaceae bacterium]|jgi:alpha-amylase/alpha-mannosidase (GH57 family)
MPDLIQHALVLNFHQPSGNLETLLLNNEWEAKEILWAIDRMPRTLWGYEDIARVHLSLSGTLLETLSNAAFQSKVYGTVKCGDLLWYLQNTALFDVLGTGYYHPVLPLIPMEDWEEQCRRWLGIGRHIFWRPQFSGFWPPEMGFCMEMIPLLCKLGYRYVMVDSRHIEPEQPMRWEEVRYRPHFARYGSDEIIVVVRDRELSDAQESGMDWGWFAREVNERTKWCDFPPLVTTCTDGDNGGWFRNTSGKGNFWEYFYREYLDKVRSNQCNIRPAFITDYLDKYGAAGRVRVLRGAWNTGWHDGIGFTQWTGSRLQNEAFSRIAEVSGQFHRLEHAVEKEGTGLSLYTLLNEAQWRLLRAETSCNFFWGDAWVDKCHADLNAAVEFLDQVEKEINKKVVISDRM